MSSRPPEPKKKEKKPLFKFGPFEQAIAMLVVMGFASNPTLPYTLLAQPNPFGGEQGIGGGGVTNIPLFTPPMMMLVIIAYVGYQILKRQEATRERNKALKKSSSSSSSSSSRSSGSSSRPSGSSAGSSGSSGDKKPMTSADVRSKGLPSSSSSKVGVGDPKPKHVSGGSGLDPTKDPSSNAFKKNYFLTMQGPGRPALVPFQDGMRPKAGSEAGSLWWDNIPDDAEGLMAPPMDPDKVRGLMKNPYIAEILQGDIDLLKMKKQRKEEEERYEKVANILQTMLGGLLCAVDMRLGVAAIIFFLYRHFSLAKAKEDEDMQDEIEAAKNDLMKKISEAKKAGGDRSHISMLQQELSQL